MEEKQKNNEQKKKKQYILFGILFVLVVVLAFLVYFMVTNEDKEDENELAYTELIQEINDGNVEKIEMTVGSTTIKVKLKDVEEEKTTIVPSTQAFTEFIQQKVDQGNDGFELIQKPTNALVSIGTALFSLLPTILLVILIILFFKMQGLGDKGKVYDSETTKSKMTIDDVAG